MRSMHPRLCHHGTPYQDHKEPTKTHSEVTKRILKRLRSKKHCAGTKYAQNIESHQQEQQNDKTTKRQIIDSVHTKPHQHMSR